MHEMTVLITGCAGFIGMHVTLAILSKGINVVGLDNLNDYYNLQLKLDRLSIIKKNKKFTFIQENVEDLAKIENTLITHEIDKIIHLAGQAGVRYSIENPGAYLESNVKGFFNILEFGKKNNIQHILYASSSSVYGLSDNKVFNESDSVDRPLSFYAVTKRTNELMAFYYSNAFSLRLTGLRFFTVYGPWGRPDMSPFIFTESILKKKPIKIFNHGKMSRDFTYIEDVVEGILKIFNHEHADGDSRYEILNIGNGNPVSLMNFIDLIEANLKLKAIREYLPLQLGDVQNTHSNTKLITDKYGYKPKVSIDLGVRNYIEWFKSYYK
jgi:UDP-glucuronate 4-epimerase